MPSCSSLVYNGCRICAYGLLVILHILLTALFALSIHDRSGGPTEIACLFIHILAILVLVFQSVYFLYRCNAEPSNNSHTIISGLSCLLCTIGAIVITARATDQPGIVDDFSAVSDSYHAALAAIALSWLAMWMSAMTVVFSVVQKNPGAVEGSPYTSAPVRHRVVFHKDHRPLKIIEVIQGSDPEMWDREKGRAPQAPQFPPPILCRDADNRPARDTHNMNIHWLRESV
ncbi:uncharacterized protein LAESUDRAFT_755129 [Laetiporus sulphureus 93-53]|uniref:MARVEL domain-containing protein n=1 Tax=Laetiporus sulphureus 93-53 TaxID=1314785 RepID=A0A165HB05_9APHY|nr:uncharacterized protein LAESUDRAFT_755129 [Laetiporus sulphureus 93-53]KZT11486.1 hypothetical protein LAESUDRAFT_755129 [Laetiporus sulphureus 93-53]